MTSAIAMILLGVLSGPGHQACAAARGRAPLAHTDPGLEREQGHPVPGRFDLGLLGGGLPTGSIGAGHHSRGALAADDAAESRREDESSKSLQPVSMAMTRTVGHHPLSPTVSLDKPGLSCLSRIRCIRFLRLQL